MRSLKRNQKNELGKKVFLAVFLLGFVVLMFYYSFRIDEDRYDKEIAKAAEKYNVDSRFVKAVIYQESRFDAHARGAHGEIGLMQVMPDGAAVDWARHYKKEKLREITQWLDRHIYAQGGLYEPQDLLAKVSKKALDASIYTEYLTNKLSKVYDM